MPYDEVLADRVRSIVATLHPGAVEEKRMFGGLALMLKGNMAVVVRGRGGLMVRVDPADTDTFASEPGAEATEMRGRTMRGWISVSPDVLANDADLRRWVERGVSFTATLSGPKSR
jgi:TfoX/Sxy family transcriptional regulator of competence genes